MRFKFTSIYEELEAEKDHILRDWNIERTELLNRISELETENKRLRDALEHIARHFGSAEQCRELAQSAWEGE